MTRQCKLADLAKLRIPRIILCFCKRCSHRVEELLGSLHLGIVNAMRVLRARVRVVRVECARWWVKGEGRDNIKLVNSKRYARTHLGRAPPHTGRDRLGSDQVHRCAHNDDPCPRQWRARVQRGGGCRREEGEKGDEVSMWVHGHLLV
jgi:hypothetical protein